MPRKTEQQRDMERKLLRAKQILPTGKPKAKRGALSMSIAKPRGKAVPGAATAWHRGRSTHRESPSARGTSNRSPTITASDGGDSSSATSSSPGRGKKKKRRRRGGKGKSRTPTKQQGANPTL